MKIISNKKKLIRLIQREDNLGLVPTMGAIHLGHISLIKKSKSLCKKTVVSIFVNKPQFNRKSDFQKYPRVLGRDIYLLKKQKIDYLFLPKFNEIYKNGPKKNINLNAFKKELCGKYRPGHFEAVVDVVNRFINIIKPKKIFLGEKDMQQLILIKDFIIRNNIKTNVVGCKTIREKNGIAYSSRNFLLNNNEKRIASKIYKLLTNNKKKLIKKKKLINIVKKQINKFGVKKIDYIKIININKIIKPYKKIKKYRIFIAYYLRSTRLIDNI